MSVEDSTGLELAWRIHAVRSSLCGVCMPGERDRLRAMLVELLAERDRRSIDIEDIR